MIPIIILLSLLSACTYGTQINNERGSYPNQDNSKHCEVRHG